MERAGASPRVWPRIKRGTESWIAPMPGIHVSPRVGSMIVSFGDLATEALYLGEGGKALRGLPRDVHCIARRKLDMLAAADLLLDLRSPPGNRLEALRDDLQGLHSIRVTDPWRNVFRWTSSGPAEVRILDYHS